MQAAATLTAAQKAIANADAYLGDAVLPTYSEVLASLRDLMRHVAQDSVSLGFAGQSAKLLARHDKTMAGDFGPAAAEPAPELAKDQPAPAAAQPVIEPEPAGTVRTFRLATYPRNAGKRLPSGCPFISVLCVPYGDREADIELKKFTRHYTGTNSRPYVLSGSGRGFKTLPAAVAALKKERAIG